VRLVWVWRDVDAPAGEVWELLVDTDQWPAWGPSVRAVMARPRRLGPGSTGTVTTRFGFDVPFEVTAYDDGVRWAWKVAGVPATDHRIELRGPQRCRVGFGVPWPAAPYLAMCRWALCRLDALATGEPAGA
jgi:Polyketide cyclase / dehydrase and lipid transport